MHNKNLQTDKLRDICFVVQLSPHFTTKQTPHKLRLKLALGRKNIMTNIDEIVIALKTSNLILAEEVLSKKKNENWKFTDSFGESTASFAELHSTYTIRSQGLATRMGEHAMQLYASTNEFLKNLDCNLNRSCYINSLIGSEEHHYIFFIDPIEKQILGVLKVYSQLDVSKERWQEIWR